MLGEDGATVLGLEPPLERPTSRNLLTIIPARGGSRRLRGKNLLPFDHLPMFVRFAHDLPGHVVVSTDDDTIASMARTRGIAVHRRDPVPDNQDIPTASARVARDLDWEGPVLTVQPTVHPLPPLDKLLQSTEPAVLTALGRHDIWLPRHTRISRELADQVIGIYFWPAGTVGLPPTLGVRVLDYYHDIDTAEDYQAALFSPRTILVHAASPTTWNGTGHFRRQTELALQLQHHRVVFDDSAVPDLIILDQGNTTRLQIAELRERHWNCPIISFEDRGEGAKYVDAVINAVLPPLNLPHEYHGGDYAVIRPEFLGLTHSPHPERTGWGQTHIAILFGGTDAKDLTARVQGLFVEDYITTTFSTTVPETMLDADILICGAGQLVHEAAYLGVPTIVMAATQREASHGHLGPEHGNIFLGLAARVSDDQIIRAVHGVLGDTHLQEEMADMSRATVDGRGVQRIKHIIEGLLI